MGGIVVMLAAGLLVLAWRRILAMDADGHGDRGPCSGEALLRRVRDRASAR
jgi:DNA/RNA-binding domain of Phe-tRNA-synthetase-like protein